MTSPFRKRFTQNLRESSDWTESDYSDSGSDVSTFDYPSSNCDVQQMKVHTSGAANPDESNTVLVEPENTEQIKCWGISGIGKRKADESSDVAKLEKIPKTALEYSTST